MSARHPYHGTPEHEARRRKGSSQDRLNAEIALAEGGKRLLRQRGRKKLFAQPRNLLRQWPTFNGKWGGAEIRHIRAIKGVGRPPRARLTPDPVVGVLERWGF